MGPAVGPSGEGRAGADGRTDPRIARSRAAVLAAARGLLEERCFVEITVEAVAAASGVAKTTIYRHWPSREALLVDLVEDLKPPQPPVDSGSFAGDLSLVGHQLAEALGDTSWSRALPGLLDAAEREADLRRIIDTGGRRRRQVLQASLDRARERGEVDHDIDLELAVSLVAGPIFYRRLVLREAPTPEFVDRVVAAATISLGLAGPPGPCGPAGAGASGPAGPQP